MNVDTRHAPVYVNTGLELVLPGGALVARLRWLGGEHCPQEVMRNVSSCNARDVRGIVCWRNFNDVGADDVHAC